MTHGNALYGHSLHHLSHGREEANYITINYMNTEY